MRALQSMPHTTRAQALAPCSPSGRVAATPVASAPAFTRLRWSRRVAAAAQQGHQANVGAVQSLDSAPGLAPLGYPLLATPPPGLSRATTDPLPPLNQKCTWLSLIEDGVYLFRQEFGLPGDLGPFVNGFAFRLRDGTYLVRLRLATRARLISVVWPTLAHALAISFCTWGSIGRIYPRL